MIYITLILAFVILSYIYDYRDKEKNRLLWWLLLLVVLICVSGFRYQMGADSIRYERYYADVPKIGNLRIKDFQNTRFAPLYILLCSFCKTITSEFMLLQFVEAILVNGVFFWFIWKHTRHVFFGGLLYLLFLYIMLNMQVLREAFAVSVFLISWPYFKDRKWLQYYLFCVVAFFFHVSSLILFILPIILVPGVRELFVFGRRTIIIVPILLAVSFLVKYFLFDFIKMIAFTETMAERATMYSKDDMGGNTLNVFGSIGNLVRYTLYPLLALYFLKDRHIQINRKSQDIPVMERMALVGIYVAILSIGIMIFIRYVNYFEIFSLIFVADWIFTGIRIKGKIIRLNFVYWYIIMLPLFATQIRLEYWTKVNRSGSIKNIDMYWPYSNQFDREIAPNRKKAIEISRHF